MVHDEQYTAMIERIGRHSVGLARPGIAIGQPIATLDQHAVREAFG
jgi:hypothetical protein